MKKRLLCLLVVLVLCLVISLVALATELPSQIGIAAETVGSGTYSKAMVFASVIKDATKMSVRLMPNDTQMGVAQAMRSQQMVAAYYTGTGMFYIAHGLDVFGSSEWGPQPVRSTLMGMNGCSFAVADNSDIKEWADMKGKRVAVSPGTPIVADANFAFLAYGSINPDEVVQIVVTGMGGAFEALLNGTVDGQFLPFVGAAATEMEGSPRGIRWLLMDPDNKDGWERLQKYLPMYGPFLSKIGAGCTEEKPVWGGGYLVGLYAYKNENPDIIYAISKAIFEGYDSYKDVTADLKYWDQEMFLNNEKQILPMHDGTVSFFKDIGKWTPEMERWQIWKIKQEEGRLEAWPKVVEMAKDKNIKVGSEEFLVMWKEYLWDNGLVSTPGKAPLDEQ